MIMHEAESTFSCAVGWWIKKTKKSSVWKWDEREERLWRNNLKRCRRLEAMTLLISRFLCRRFSRKRKFARQVTLIPTLERKVSYGSLQRFIAFNATFFSSHSTLISLLLVVIISRRDLLCFTFPIIQQPLQRRCKVEIIDFIQIWKVGWKCEGFSLRLGLKLCLCNRAKAGVQGKMKW